MSFLKKLSETAKNTASTIGAKSADLVEMGRLKLAKAQIEGKINDKKLEIGEQVYTAHKQGVVIEKSLFMEKLIEIADFEAQIEEIEIQLDQLKEPNEPQQAAATPTPPPPPFTEETVVESEQTAEVKKCANCGAELSEGVKFCSSCGTAI